MMQPSTAIGYNFRAVNQEIARQLTVMADVHGNDLRRHNAYLTAAKNIAKWNQPITSGAQAQREINGVGASIAGKIDEILASGHITELTNLNPQDKERLEVERLFRTIKGVGKVTAHQWYLEGYRTLQDLIKKYPLMTAGQQLGFYHYNDLIQRVPRSEIDMINRYLHQVLDPLGVKFEIAGSYRRGGATSGDIDVLLQLPPVPAGQSAVDLTPAFMKRVIDPLIASGFIVGTIAYGSKSKYSGIIRLNNLGTQTISPVRQLDMRFIRPEDWWHGLLHFTGSDHFNKEMRLRAISMGLSLSEYGLVDKNGRRFPYDHPPTSEKDIFDALKVKYLEPAQRTETVQLEYLDGAQPIQSINDPTVYGGQWSRPNASLLIYIANDIGRYIRNPAVIAGFDLDHTLINNMSGETFSRGLDDVVVMPNRREILYNLIHRGYTVVIFTNQSSRSEKETATKFARVDHALKLLNLPVILMMATAKDQYRKPAAGMWSELLKLIPNVDVQKSFYCGDAANRPQDHSGDDIDFARNIKLRFMTPEEVFKPTVFREQ
jgi:DNA 3'-phosphatase